MFYALIENGVVKQIQPNKAKGFVSVPDNIVCGMLHDDTGDFKEVNFSISEQDSKVSLVVNYEEQIKRELDRSEKHVTTDPPYPDDVAVWVTYRALLRTDLRNIPDMTLTILENYTVPVRPFFGSTV